VRELGVIVIGGPCFREGDRGGVVGLERFGDLRDITRPVASVSNQTGQTL
jgi:hypothetical protein